MKEFLSVPELILIVLGLGILALLVVLLFRLSDFRERERLLADQIRDSRTETIRSIQNQMNSLGDILGDTQRHSADLQDKRLAELNRTLEARLTAIQTDSAKKLEEMRLTVDERLQKTLEERLGQSFRLVSERLEQVYRGLGEMQTLAAGVGDLKKVLANVKTRGILGEIQLEAILEQILTTEQYSVNQATRPGSSERVEFAVRLPGDDQTPVWLPIDAKFPAETYHRLVDAYEKAESAEIEQAWTTLERSLRGFAKSIRDKYIEVPYTTDFAIMFLPFEGLYAEAVRRGMSEPLQRDYKVTLAGPTTMAALLNSLQMGFRTLAIEKRSSQVWNVLGAVKTEFEKFGGVLEMTQQRINQANAELDKLIGVRTRQIRNKLRDVAALPEDVDDLDLAAPGATDGQADRSAEDLES
ncbi:MAG TPA: DNA recombination protein RmuC [Clostridiales bacterium]|jgi:DNA recombination protein RmuC|nr:DNA recombination protein RmuC [Clostridiales bacterium]